MFVDVNSPCEEKRDFYTMASPKMYKIPNLVVISTDLPLPTPVSKTVELSTAADVKLAVGHKRKYFPHRLSLSNSLSCTTTSLNCVNNNYL